MDDHEKRPQCWVFEFCKRYTCYLSQQALASGVILQNDVWPEQAVGLNSSWDEILFVPQRCYIGPICGRWRPYLRPGLVRETARQGKLAGMTYSLVIILNHANSVLLWPRVQDLLGSCVDRLGPEYSSDVKGERPNAPHGPRSEPRKRGRCKSYGRVEE